MKCSRRIYLDTSKAHRIHDYDTACPHSSNANKIQKSIFIADSYAQLQVSCFSTSHANGDCVVEAYIALTYNRQAQNRAVDIVKVAPIAGVMVSTVGEPARMAEATNSSWLLMLLKSECRLPSDSSSCCGASAIFDTMIPCVTSIPNKSATRAVRRIAVKYRGEGCVGGLARDSGRAESSVVDMSEGILLEDGSIWGR